MRKRSKIYYLRFIIYFITGLPVYWFTGLLNPVLAKEIPLGPLTPIPGAYEPKGEGGSETLTTIFSNFFGILTLVAGIMFFIYFLLAALAWITSSGKPDKVQQAQDKMTHAAIGFIAIVATYTIAYLVGKILGVNILNPASYIENFWGGR